VKLAEMRGKDSRSLLLDIQSMRKELFELRFRGTAEEISNTARFRDLRRGVARIRTILRQREIESAKAQKGSEV
jgi:large subunit ribosomal protein L29